MSNNPNNFIQGAAATDILTNQETIQGAGSIGGGQMGLVNSGTIIANASSNLTIGVSSSGFHNTGTIEAAGGTLSILGPGTTFFANDNQTTNTLTGGTYIANGNNIQWAAGSGGITTLSANVTEENGGQLFNTTNSSNALIGLTSIASTGALTIGGVAFADSGSFSNAGSLTLLTGESFTVGTLAQIGAGSLTAGTYVLDANLNLSGATQNITANAANLTLAGGTIENAIATNALAGLASNTRTLTIAGTANNFSTTATSFSNTGTLTINAGDSFTAGGLAQISSGTLTAGTYVLSGNLNLTTAGINITKNSATLTLQGGTIQTGTTNDLANLSSNTGSLTLANNAPFTTVGSFTNSGTLTVNKGSKFTVTTGTLTNLSGGTLANGTYVIGGTVQLPTANGGIVTNAANLTLSGTAAKIFDGTANALAGFNNNTGTFALSSGAAFTAASSNFTNSGTVTVAKGTTLTVPGTGNSYGQTAGQTTIDGTLAGISGGASVTGGTILGTGSVKGKLSVGNASGSVATINVGDSAKAGLLSITGTYTQLATGAMTGLVNGTTAGTGFSQLKVTGAAALAGTINFTVATAFQPSLTVGETFTALTASSVTGTFSNSTIAINSSFHFVVSYTSTGVVLTVASGPASVPKPATARPTVQIATVARREAAVTKAKTRFIVSHQGRSISGTSKYKGLIVVASWPLPTRHSNMVLVRGSEMMRSLRRWERVPVVPTTQAGRLVAVARAPRMVNVDSSRASLPTSDLRMGQSHAIRVQAPVTGWTGISSSYRGRVKIMQPMFRRITR
jgi:hypothetical protein